VLELAKVPPAPNAPAPKNMYSVLLEKQAVYGNAFWSAAAAAPALIAQLARFIAETAGWSFAYLAAGAASVATAEKALAQQVAANAKPDRLAVYVSAVDALSALAAAATAKPTPVAGDLYALAGALSASTAGARGLIP
jgi:hypothetical protein